MDEITAENRIDKAKEIIEYIMEADPRTLRNPDCENAWIFDKVYAALMVLKYGQEKF